MTDEYRGVLVRTDSTVEEVTLNGSLQSLQSFIGGGWVESFGPEDGSWTGWCDEEGKLKGMPINRLATDIAHSYGWPWGDVLVGDVLFTGPAGPEGENTSIPEWMAEVMAGGLDG